MTPRMVELPRGLFPHGWKRIDKFRYTSDLHLMRARQGLLDVGREAQYVVSQEYSFRFQVDGRDYMMYVPEGMLTDLASVPRLARWFIGRVGPHLEAAIIHDFLFIAWQDIEDYTPLREDFRFANEVMHQAMKSAGVPGWKRWLIKQAISSGVAWSVYKERNRLPRYVEVRPRVS